MKKIYNTPEITTIPLHASALLTTSNLTSGGTKTEDFVGESKAYQRGFVWDETEEE
ncbi:MAG: hypothetical protein IJT90_03475 [Bacteroidaceae bacterium]|nr:hypothetical protein [Bacteroidaceae bacterium]